VVFEVCSTGIQLAFLFVFFFSVKSMRSIWLLAAWATMSSALVVTSPQPNYKLPIGTPFQVAWQTLGTTFPGVINVYLLSSSSPADIVTVVQTGISDQLGQFAITVPQVQPNTYYLHLADTSPNQGDYVAGPFYFTNSVTVPSASSGSPQFPVWIIPIIIVLVLAVCQDVSRTVSKLAWIIY
jgi:hypothetical protein